MALRPVINFRACPVCRHAMSGPAQRKRCQDCSKARQLGQSADRNRAYREGLLRVKREKDLTPDQIEQVFQEAEAARKARRRLGVA